jgi:hydrogenase nickel incorporation protein HypA/HybF
VKTAGVHELSLMQSLVAAVEDEVAGPRILAVRLEVGALSCADPDALRFCFDLCARGTRLEGATLDILAVSGRGRCRTCGEEGAVPWLGAPCGCGSFDLEIVAGQELRLRNVEVI